MPKVTARVLNSDNIIALFSPSLCSANPKSYNSPQISPDFESVWGRKEEKYGQTESERERESETSYYVEIDDKKSLK